MSNVKVKMKINTDEIANVIEVTENSIRISNRNQQNANPNPSIQSQKKTRFYDSTRLDNFKQFQTASNDLRQTYVKQLQTA